MISRFFLFFLWAAVPLAAVERPNILWITSEDNDKYWLGCYENKNARTPSLDALAEESVRFEHFFSNAPVCAVARSTILTGVHAPSQGSQHMRSRHPIPASYKPYVSYLREAGYYTSNASKTDYNFEINDKSLWDECSKSAHYKNRGKDQPFFAIFNLTDCHESSLFPEKTANARESGKISATPRLNPEEIHLRSYLPDLPEIRQDVAIYSDFITLMDERVGQILAELEKEGLAEDTIVFYYSDHGGVTPRGKRYLKDTGVNVPLLIRVPEKWKKFSPFSAGEVTKEVASFVDLAPTVLSLLGTKTPAYMQGRAILGAHRVEPSEQNYTFLFADRFDELYGIRRGLTDGRWKYIRRFTPSYSAAPYSFFQFGQRGWQAWRQAWQDGKLEPRFNRMWEKNQVVEELFDTEQDPWEVQNLASDPAHRTRLEAMRKALREQMVEYKDTGLVPEPFFAELAPRSPIADYVSSREENWSSVVDLAFAASTGEAGNLPQFVAKLSSSDPLERYWGVQGCLLIGKKANESSEALTTLLDDSHAAVRAAAAHALVSLGHREDGIAALKKELNKKGNDLAQLNVCNILIQLGAQSEISDEWVKSSQGKNRRKYVQRIAARLAQERGL